MLFKLTFQQKIRISLSFKKLISIFASNRYLIMTSVNNISILGIIILILGVQK